MEPDPSKPVYAYGIEFLQQPIYYAAPDGQKPVDKIVATCKKGLMFGLLAGGYDALFYTQTRNVLETVNCVAYTTVPLVGMCAAFAAVTYTSTKIRGKEDMRNYMIGAASCAPILHSWKKCTSTTVWLTLSLIIACMGTQYIRRYNIPVHPVPKHLYGTYEFDMSVIKPRDKNFRSPNV